MLRAQRSARGGLGAGRGDVLQRRQQGMVRPLLPEGPHVHDFNGTARRAQAPATRLAAAGGPGYTAGMGPIQASCGACGRVVNHRDGRKLLERPLCAVCGGPLVFSDADRSALEALARQETSAREAAQRVVRLRCGFCARTTAVRGLAPGEARTCAYCGCPYRVTDDGGGSRPGFALPGAPPSPADIERAGAALDLGRFGERYQAAGGLPPAVRLAARALQVRLALEVVPLDEARRALDTLARIPNSDPPGGSSDWVCPLPAAWACDLIERLLCPTRGVERDLGKAAARVLKVRTFGPLEDVFVQRGGGAAPSAQRPVERPAPGERVREAIETSADVVDAAERVHAAWEKADGAFGVVDALEAVGDLELLNLGLKALQVLDRKEDGGSRTQQALEDLAARSEAWADDIEYSQSYGDDRVLHHLRITFVEAEGGTSMAYAHQRSDGGLPPLDRCQKRLIYAIQRGLARFGGTLACFKSVYGDWLGAGGIQCLAEECFRERLRALHPDLESFAGVYSLVLDARRAG